MPHPGMTSFYVVSFQISQGFTIRLLMMNFSREATEIDKMIAVSDAHLPGQNIIQK